MGDKWRETIFGDCAELVRDTCQPNNSFGKPYIGLEHIEQRTLSLNSIGIADDVTSTKNNFKSGDILFGKLRPYFRKVVRPKFDGICSTDIWVVRAKNGVDQGFLFYWMASKEFVDIANQGAEGTKMPRAKWDFVTKIKKEIPPLPEQKAIASILGALDDKIELNRKMNETLEAMARAIFKSCFSYPFDGLKYLQAETPSPDLTGHPLPQGEGRGEGELELVDSPLGKIPKGWRVGTLGEMCEITMGQSPPGETYNEMGEGLSFYQGIRDFGFRFTNKRVYCNAPTRLANEGDVLLSVRAPVGSLNIASEKCAIGRGVAALRIKGQHYGFLYYLMKETQGRWERYEAEGTVFGSATKMDVQNFSIIVPSIKAISGFNKVVFPMDKTIKNNEMQSRTLASIRDALLPKLLSGEIRVKDAERFVEEAV